MTPRKRTLAPAPAPPPDKPVFTLISNQRLLDLYRAMLRCRLINERIAEPGAGSASKSRPSAHQSETGREASAAGVTLALLDGDSIVPAPGDPGPCLVKGVSLAAIFSALRTGRAPAAYRRANVVKPAKGFAARFDAASAIARENKRAKKGRIVVLFLAPEDAQSAAWQKSLRVAVSRRLPMILVSTTTAGADDLIAGSHRLGLPPMTVDGDDVVAVYRVASEAVAHARRGNGPTLIDCRPFLLPGQKKRTAAHTPIRAMEKYLAVKGLFSRKLKTEAEAAFELELAQAVGGRLAR